MRQGFSLAVGCRGDGELCGVIAGYGYLCFLTEHGAAHTL